MSNLHRVCCCSVTSQPRLVRGGWYHFIALNSDKTIAVIVGNVSQTQQGGVCAYETIPGPPPEGHPLAIPTAVASKHVIDVEAGAYHCVVRHDDHTIACWGLNTMGQCNVPTTSSKGDLTDPDNGNLKKIVGLHAGYSTTAVTFNDGTVVCWGDPAVADVVNGWTDILMSPPVPRIDPHTKALPIVTDIDAVATDNAAYFKPALDGAYDTSSETVTYNLHIDRLEEWHTGQKPCLPMFDLGVETNPHLPMELNVEAMTALPSINVQFPRRDPENPDPSTQAFTPECDCEDELGPWTADYIEKCWRDFVFSAQDQLYGDGVKSCCDLEIQKDFAVAMRRTGQVITTRNTNSNGSCPTGQTDGRSNCRDCLADQWIDVFNANTTHATGGGGTLTCNCPADQKFDYDNGGGILTTCISDGCGFGVPKVTLLEGIGCVGANFATERFGYDPNWAKAALGLNGRFTSAEQVRAGNPVWNGGNLQFGWGNSRTRVFDTLEPPAGGGNPNCVTAHPQGSTCNDLCPGLTTYSLTHGSQNNYGKEAKYDYPVQFYCAGIHGGTNTTHWNSAPVGLDYQGVAFGDCTPVPSAAAQKCKDCGEDTRHCGPLRQFAIPNGGVFSYGCIYSLTLDKYNYDNSYRAQYRDFYLQDTPGVCSSVEPAAWSWGRMGSKPWGPWHMGVRNGVGDAFNRKGNVCHCCACQGGGGISGHISPSPGYPVVVVPYHAQDCLNNAIGYSVNGVYDQIDKVLGTLFGMPWEHNWQHTFDQSNPLNGSGPTCNPDCFHVWKGACCVGVNQPCSSATMKANPWTGTCTPATVDQGYSYYGASFGMYHPPRSVASTRMAFAVIRPDHRVYELVGGESQRVDKTDNSIAQPGPAIYGKDETQYETCDFAINGCPGSVNEFGECATPCEDPREPLEQTCAQIRTEHMLHIWGSLWDPCPPWPRVCLSDCDLLSEDPESEKICCDPSVTAAGAPNKCCCDPSVTNPSDPMYCSPGEAENCGCVNDHCCDPDTDPECPCDPRLNGPCKCPPYPVWTRVPTTVKIGTATPAANSERLSAVGSWQTISGNKVWVMSDPKDCQYDLPYLPHSLCIDCTDHVQDFETTSDYSHFNG